MRKKNLIAAIIAIILISSHHVTGNDDLIEIDFSFSQGIINVVEGKEGDKEQMPGLPKAYCKMAPSPSPVRIVLAQAMSEEIPRRAH